MKRYFVVLLVFGLLYNTNTLSTGVSTTPVQSLTLEDYDTAILPGRTVCGTIKETTRIYGGKAVQLGEFPWIVAVEYTSVSTGEASVKCAGSLINERYVVTTASCVTNAHLKPENAILGEWKLHTDPDCVKDNECADPIQKIKIRNVIAHEKYNSTLGINDIALLRLDKDVVYTEFISPICLPPKNLPFPQEGKHVTVAGWGKTEQGKLSDILLKVDLPIFSRVECGTKINRVIPETAFCAGGEEGKDSCIGDSGSPAIHIYGDEINQARWYQYGIVAYGAGCGKAGFAGVYTSVDKFVDWIVSSIKSH